MTKLVIESPRLTIGGSNIEITDTLTREDSQGIRILLEEISFQSDDDGGGMYMEITFRDKNSTLLSDDEVFILTTISRDDMRHIRDFINTEIENTSSE